MSSGFDPYHTWLGIPACEQPASHYRLLSLELFEEDLDAIECAADRLIKYVRHAATVEQSQQARAIVGELSAAKRCLLIAEQKQAYDAGLRAGRATTQHSKRMPAVERIETSAAVQVTPIPFETRVAAHSRPKSKQTPLHLVVIASATALIGLSGLGFAWLRGNAETMRQVEELPGVLRTSEIWEQEIWEQPEVDSPISNEPTTRAAGGITSESEVKAIVPGAEATASESSLPEFVSQSPTSEPTSDHETPSVGPIDSKSPLVVVGAPPAEPPAPHEAKSERAIPAKHVTDETVERGGLLRELWRDVTGNNVEEFVQFVAKHPEPSHTETIDRLETPEDFDDQYGQRLRGYLYPPATGSYEFSIRANAEAWLYVSTNAMPENKQRVEPETKIEFEAGQAYYVEALHKESTGRDYLSIGWKLPDGTEETPILGERLSVHHRIAPRHETEFVVLTPQSANSSFGTNLELLEDGVISAPDAASSNEMYQLMFEPEMETITAVRLEAIPHESLPASGPGCGPGGRFSLADLSIVAAGRAASDASRSLSFVSAVDDAGRDLRRIVDGDEKTVWRVSGRGERAAVTLTLKDPARFTVGATVKVELKQRQALGRFRFLATSAPNPRAASRPSAGMDRDEASYSLFVNLGGDEFTTLDGIRWRASTFFDNETFGHEGGRGVVEDLIANKVQGSALRGITAFRAIVPEGTYDVTLYFCEYWSTTPGSRRFAIAAEQRLVTASFDLFQAAGGIAKPLVYPIRNVKVTDGRLDLDFREASEGASTILNAVRIQQVR